MGVLLSHQPQEASPILAAPPALPTCPLPTNLFVSCSQLPARCLVINGVSFGSTPAGDRGTPSPAPPVPTPPCPSQFGGWRGGQDRPRTRCMCLPPAVCLGSLMSLLPSWGCLCQVWGGRLWRDSARRDIGRSLGMSSGSAADPRVILVKLLPFSGPQFPICGMGRLN